MKKLLRSFTRQAYVLFVLLTICMTAQAQQPILVHNQDTTYLVTDNTLGEIIVMAKRYKPSTSLDELIKTSTITTTVNGFTKDLQRDLPSTIRLYTPQGIPILTKYTSNNSLTSSIPDSAVTLELRESSAKFPNPDVPIILKSNYGRNGNISLSPFTQTVNVGTDTEQVVAAKLALSHSGPPEMLTNLLPELNAYNTTYAGFGAVQAKTSATKTELIFHHSQSANEYGNLLNIQEFYEDDRNTNISLTYALSLGNTTIDAGIISQNGREVRNVKETSKSYEVVNEIEAISYTAALSNNTTELRVYYHDFNRVYSWPVDSVHQQRFESVVTHEQTITKGIDFTLETRFDFKDLEPSVSGNLDIQASGHIFFKLNGGRMFDAVGSEGLNNIMNSVQLSPYPWTVTYGSLDTNLRFDSFNITTSLMHKTLERGWYNQSADISGWIGRIGANGLLFWNSKNISYLKWNYEGVARKLTLGLPGRNLQVMPGPAKFEQHISVEAGFGNMRYAVQFDSYIDRHMRIDRDVSVNLGPQHFLSIDASRKMGAVKLGLTLNNLLALSSIENYIGAYVSDTKELSYVSAPPFLDLNLRINLY